MLELGSDTAKSNCSLQSCQFNGSGIGKSPFVEAITAAPEAKLLLKDRERVFMHAGDGENDPVSLESVIQRLLRSVGAC